MDNSANMLQLCRLCLVKDEVNIPIFEEQGDIRQIFLKISSCLPVKVSREDKLPKKICDGCSCKLDMLYEFWNTSANAEKQLLSWLGEAGMSAKMNDGHMSAVAQQIKPNETLVKEEELDPSDLQKEEDDDDEDDEEKSYMFQQKLEENNAGPSATATSNEEEEQEQPPPKRARRTAAVKAAIAMDHDSDDDDDSGEPLTKVEDESEDSDCEDAEPAFVDAPSTSADDQPGPSGVGKDGADAPKNGKLDLVRKRKRKSKGMKKPFKENKLFKENKPMNFICKFCNIRGKDILNMHMKTHYVCKQCKRSFVSEDSMNKHRNSMHFYNVICKVCSCSLDPALMPEHEKRCKPVKAPVKSPPVKLKCKICGKSFKTNEGLNMHCLKVHDKKLPKNVTQKPFTCNLCDRSFRTKLLFTMHKQSHTKDIKFMCKFCYKGFKNSAELHAHAVYHNVKRARFCEVCSNSIPKNSELEGHVCKITV